MNEDADSDSELLRRYAETRDDAAFATLVRRHIDFVYSAALRQVNGDAHLASDVSQSVFTDLARKAAALGGHRVLAGWLFTSTRFAAAKAVRGEQRRRAREREAHLMEQMNREADAPLDWARVRPVLDEIIGELGATDREAILLRFFAGRDYADVGAQLHLNDNAARMRVERALEKLRALLQRRGLRSSSAALTAALSAHAVAAAPAGLATAVTGVALGAGSAAAPAAAFFTMAKLQIGISGALAAAAVTCLVVQSGTNAELRAEKAGLGDDNRPRIAQLSMENARLVREAADVAAIRRDDTALAQLGEQTAELQRRQETVIRAEQARAAARAAERVYDMGNVDDIPQLRSPTQPAYPFALRTAGVTGEATVQFVVDAEGRVQDARAVRSAATGAYNNTEAAAKLFEEAAVKAVEKWRFSAGRKAGIPVNTRMQIPIVFSLDEEGTKQKPRD